VEVIAVDDGSSDSTLEVLRAFGNGIKVITGPNRGAASARNIGLAQASGEFVMFLDADDYIEANSLECWLRDARDADLVLGPFELERDGRRLPGRGPRDSSDIRSFLLDWVAGQFTPPCALLWRTSFVRAIGGWGEDVLRNDDGELVVRAVLKGAKRRSSKDGIGVYVQHSHPSRVSLRKDREASASELQAFQRLVPLVSNRQADISEALGHFFYSIARRAYVEGLCDIANAALGDARKLGLKEHPGTGSHKVFSRLIGLRAKTQLAQSIARFASRLDRD
jgi:glycosyltransferase involved in cell wall biosynthesis